MITGIYELIIDHIIRCNIDSDFIVIIYQNWIWTLSGINVWKFSLEYSKFLFICLHKRLHK